MANKIYEDIRSTLQTNPRHWIEQIGFTVKGAGNNRALNCVCPRCEAHKKVRDAKAACAIFVDNGNLNCKGCGWKTKDFVDTYRDLKGIAGDHAMQKAAEELAGVMGVEFTKWDPKDAKAWHAKLPPKMNSAVAESSVNKLLEGKEFGPLRTYIREKWGVTVEQAASLGLGAWNHGKSHLALVYRCYEEKSGDLTSRYRVQIFTRVEGNWKPGPRKWNSGSGHCPDLWPSLPPEQKDACLIVEGESDAISASATFADCDVLALTKGKNARLSHGNFPTRLKGKRIIICQDLDAFRGPKDQIEGGNQSERDGIWQHTITCIRNLANYFLEHGCSVLLARVPLDPHDNPKGDLRDWIAAGGRELGELETFTYDEVFKDYDKVIECSSVLEAMTQKVGSRIAIVGKLGAIEEREVALPTETKIECDMMAEGMEKTCERCYVPRILSDRIIRWRDFECEQTQSAVSKNPEADIANRLLRKPRGCSSLRLNNTGTDPRPACTFTLVDNDRINQKGNKIFVLSTFGRPSPVGDLRVVGRVWLAGNQLFLRAESVEELGANVWEAEGNQLHTCLQTLPHGTNDIDKLTSYTDALAECIGDHVTHVYGQPVLQLGVILGLCSTLRFKRRGDEEARGFMDVGIIGVTRSGKSQTLKGFFREERFGIMTQAGSRVSVPGLTISNYHGLMQPGTFPKFHGRAVVLDEFHTAIKQSRRIGSASGGIIQALQRARSDGVVDSNQATGDFSLPAACRLFIVANPIKENGNPESHGRAYCLHFRDLYMDDECLSRMDYPIYVKGVSNKNPSGVPDTYPREMLEYLILRAWAQTPEEVVFAEGVEEMAREIAGGWRSLYDETLPFYTGSEKDESVLRIAIAVANLSFSHTTDYRQVEVRKVHVEWAKRWLEARWHECGYDEWSFRSRGKKSIAKHQLATACALSTMEPWEVVNTLSNFMSEISANDAPRFAPGDDFMAQNAWVQKMRQHGIFVRSERNLMLSPAGRVLFENLITLAEDNPDELVNHRERCRKDYNCHNLSDEQEWALYADEIGLS